MKTKGEIASVKSDLRTDKTRLKESAPREPDGVVDGGDGFEPIDPPAIANSDYDGFYGLSDMNQDERFAKWRSLLTTEDLMVAALMKRFMYEGEAITNFAAYHGLRDAMGVLISKVKHIDETTASQIDKFYGEAGDGSGDDGKMPPAPNP